MKKIILITGASSGFGALTARGHRETAVGIAKRGLVVARERRIKQGTS